MNDMEKVYFAELNQNELSVEMAQGEGEKLVTLAGLYGCSGKAGQAFAETVQSNYEKIIPTPETSATHMLENLNQVMKQSGLNSVCGSI